MYLIAAFSWWAILLYQKNETNYALQKQLATYEKSIEPQAIREAYEKQRKMIISEGAVFGLSILFGLLLINRAYKSELRLNQRLNDFLLSVTHELKTPIASLKLVNKTLQRTELNAEERKELLQTGWDESLRLESQVNNILAAAQIEQSYTFNFERVELTELLEKRIVRFRKMFPDREINFNGDKQYYANIDIESIHRVIDNLLHNAIKYSGPGAPVALSMSKVKDKIAIEVKDQGIGIPTNERTKIWDKFYRIGNEETREQPGTGLGLWIAKEITSAHEGQLSYAENKPQGSSFTISLQATA